MKVGTTILAGLMGTTAMTLFSYAVSAFKKDNFKEPELLSLLIQKRPNGYKPRVNLVAGWLLHYTLGCLWAGMYSVLLNALNKKPTNKRAVIFGSFGGALGVFIWKSMFKQQPQPPQIAYKQFYKQLFWAHILFALSTSKALAYLSAKQQKENS